MPTILDVNLFKNAKDGDTIYLKADTYTAETVARKSYLSLPNNISIIGQGTVTIIVNGGGTLFSAVNKNNIRIENINIVYNKQEPNPFATAIDLRGCNGVEIRGCSFEGCGASAIRSGRNAGSDISGRIFDTIGEGFGPTRNLVVSECRFTNCVGPVIGFKPGGSQNVEIRNNTFNGFGTYAISCEGEGQPQGWTSNVFIADNIILNGQLSFRKADFGVIFGIYVGEHAYNVNILRNNIMNIGSEKATFCGGIAISTSPSQGDTETSDIIIYNNCIKNIYGARSGCIILMPGNKDISGVSIKKNFLAKNYNNKILVIRPDQNKNLGFVRFLDTDEFQESTYNNLVQNGV